MNLLPQEVRDQLDSAQASIEEMNTKLDTLVEKLECVIKELRIGNERQT